jgi:hypothetical protein
MLPHARKARSAGRHWHDAGVRCRTAWVALLLTAATSSGCGGGRGELLALCTAGSVVLVPEQAAHAATIAAVGKRLGMPDHAVTVALAAAFQESGLRNLAYGDRDSLGLFQQRPSQGWGSPAKVRTPRLAAASFYTHLRRVPGWQTMRVTVAAQRVQRSAAPEAYAQWEGSSRELARALTGQVPAGLACRFRPAPRPGAGPALQAAAVAELGPDGLSGAGPPAVAWTAASWLVAHARDHGVSTVAVDGQRWEAGRGTWKPDRAATALAWS